MHKDSACVANKLQLFPKLWNLAVEDETPLLYNTLQSGYTCRYFDYYDVLAICGHALQKVWCPWRVRTTRNQRTKHDHNNKTQSQ